MRLRSLALASLTLLAATPSFSDAAAPNDPNRTPLADRPLYATDRLLIQLTPEAVASPSFRIEESGGAVTTGLAGLDTVQRTAGVFEMHRAYIPVLNRDLDRELGVSRWFMVHLPGGADIEALVSLYAADPSVAAMSPDYVAYPMAIPNDPSYALQWGHNNTGQMKNYCWGCGGHDGGTPVGTPGFDSDAQIAWDNSQGYGSASIVIAIIDSGVDIDHPDLRLVAGYDYGSNDSNPDDNSAEPGHGTACAGVAAAVANNSLGVAGAAGGCSVMPLKVADNSGAMYFSSIQNALYHAADNGADVVSMSLGAAISSDPATDTAINYAFNAGVIILAATGNENASTISYPAIHANVVGVGAASPCGDRKRSSSLGSEVNPGVNTDPNGYTCDGERWWGSNYGSTTQNAAGAVDFIAPTILPTTDIGSSGGYASGDYYNWFNGTSCATPYAAGVAALVRSKNPAWTPTQVRTALVNGCTDVVNVEAGTGWDRYSGYGMINAANALGGGGGTNSVTVTAPNGGEVLTAGTNFNITWTSTGTIANVSIAYSTNAGGAWTSIIASTTNDGSHTWTVPSVATTQGRVRVSDAANPSTTDQSNANFTIQVAGGGYATLPYTTGFESGAFDSYWTSASTGNGRIRFLTTNTPHSGTRHLCLDDATSGGYSQNEARLRLNLAGQTQVALSFWWKDFGDETHSQDGVYFSSNGGSTYVKVYNLNGGSYSNNTWRQFNLDLDALAASAGLALTSTFVVKFQQYDDYPMTTDGMAFDDISVTAVGGGGGYITSESEPNNNSGSSDGPVGSGTAVTGAISSSSDDDWFYFDVTTAGMVNISLAIGSSADLDWFLYNSSLTEVARGYTVNNPETGSYNASPGRYYLFVDGYLGAISSYTLNVSGGLALYEMGGSSSKPLPSRALPTELALHQNAPNPFGSETMIRFDLPRPGNVSLRVYDTQGRQVRTLVDRPIDPGYHAVPWDGRNDRGQKVAAGVYFFILQTDERRLDRKMIRLE